MSMNVSTVTAPPVEHRDEIVLSIDDSRGTVGMMLFIATEASLFVLLYFAYYYLSRGNWRWLNEPAPDLVVSGAMLGVMFLSAAVLYWGGKQLRVGGAAKARLALVLSILLGLVFLALDAWEYIIELKSITPKTDEYGSIFYTILTVHSAHVIVGLLMLGYVLILPQLEPAPHPPHRPYHNAAMYWYFVFLLYVSTFVLLYIFPNIR